MITDYLLNIPAAASIAELPLETQAVIAELSPEWPSFPMVGTQEVTGRKLIHVRMNQLLAKADLEALLAAHSLDWKIYSIRSAYKEGIEAGVATQGNATSTSVYIVEYQGAKQDFLPFINPIVVTVEPLTTRPVELTDTIYLSTYAGTNPIVI